MRKIIQYLLLASAIIISTAMIKQLATRLQAIDYELQYRHLTQFIGQFMKRRNIALIAPAHRVQPQSFSKPLHEIIKTTNSLDPQSPTIREVITESPQVLAYEEIAAESLAWKIQGS